MAYLSIQDFRYGMDRRRERVAGTPGTLWTLENAHITRGGDIERCKKFVPQYVLPAGTFGLYAVGRTKYVFGSADLAASVPLGVSYQRLQGPAGQVMTGVLDVTAAAGKLYVIATFDDGNIFHFYDGSRVTDWDVVGAASADFSTVANLLAEYLGASGVVEAESNDNVITVFAKTAGVPFTLTGAATNGGGTNDQTIVITQAQANVAPVAEVLATATLTVAGGSADPAANTITSILIDGVELLAVPVAWVASNETTAVKLAQQINNRASIHGYATSVSGNVVTVTARAGTGATPNGFLVQSTTRGDFVLDTDPEMAGGVTAIAAVAQVMTVAFGGTFEATDTFSLTLNGTTSKCTGLASGTGRSAAVFSNRVWSPANSLWRYSMLHRPDVFDPANAVTDNDAGFINVASEIGGGQNLITASKYQDQVAVFAEQNVITYSLDPNPAQFAVQTTLENTGTYAAKGVSGYGNTDVFYLDSTGVRSLRARSTSNAPFVSDVGNSIDVFIQAFVRDLPEATRRRAVATIEPIDGRYWLAIGPRIFVLSFFPGAKISAWSYYSPGFEVTDFARVKDRLYVRAGDTIYLHGGLTGDVYPDADEMPVLVELPFLGSDDAATQKLFNAFDMAATGDWKVEILLDPNRPDKTIEAGTFTRITYNGGSNAIFDRSTLFAAKLTCRRAGRATISMQQLHYKKGDSD